MQACARRPRPTRLPPGAARTGSRLPSTRHCAAAHRSTRTTAPPHAGGPAGCRHRLICGSIEVPDLISPRRTAGTTRRNRRASATGTARPEPTVPACQFRTNGGACPRARSLAAVASAACGGKVPRGVWRGLDPCVQTDTPSGRAMTGLRSRSVTSGRSSASRRPAAAGPAARRDRRRAHPCS